MMTVQYDGLCCSLTFTIKSFPSLLHHVVELYLVLAGCSGAYSRQPTLFKICRKCHPALIRLVCIQGQGSESGVATISLWLRLGVVAVGRPVPQYLRGL